MGIRTRCRSRRAGLAAMLSLWAVFLATDAPAADFTPEEIRRFLRIATASSGHSFSNLDDFAWFEAMERRYLDIDIATELRVPLNASRERQQRALEARWAEVGETSEAGERAHRAFLILSLPNLRARWDSIRGQAARLESAAQDVVDRSARIQEGLAMTAGNASTRTGLLLEVVRLIVTAETRNYRPLVFNPHANMISPDTKALLHFFQRMERQEYFRRLLAETPGLALDIEAQLAKIRQSSYGDTTDQLEAFRQRLLRSAREGALLRTPDSAGLEEMARVLIGALNHPEGRRSASRNEVVASHVAAVLQRWGDTPAVHDAYVEALVRREPGELGLHLLVQVGGGVENASLLGAIARVLEREAGRVGGDYARHLGVPAAARFRARATALSRAPSTAPPTTESSAPPSVAGVFPGGVPGRGCFGTSVALGLAAGAAGGYLVYELYRAYTTERTETPTKGR